MISIIDVTGESNGVAFKYDVYSDDVAIIDDFTFSLTPKLVSDISAGNDEITHWHPLDCIVAVGIGGQRPGFVEYRG